MTVVRQEAAGMKEVAQLDSGIYQAFASCGFLITVSINHRLRVYDHNLSPVATWDLDECQILSATCCACRDEGGTLAVLLAKDSDFSIQFFGIGPTVQPAAALGGMK